MISIRSESEFWEELDMLNPDAIKFDGPGDSDFFDSCIVGYAKRINLSPVLVYDERKMVDRMMFGHGMSYNDAVEYLEFNTFGAYFGENTPLILTPMDRDLTSPNIETP